MSRCPRRTQQLPPPDSADTTALVDTHSNSPIMTAPEVPVPAPVPAPASASALALALAPTDSYAATPPALLTAVPSRGHVHLIVGGNALASARCTRSVEVGAVVKVVAAGELHYGISRRVAAGEVELLAREFQVEDLTGLGREEVERVVDAVFVTMDPWGEEAAFISNKCRRLRIPVNVADAPSLSSFTLLSTYSDGPLHIGITTSGMGCKLASRLRRTVAQSLPAGIGAACLRLGRLRRRIWEEDCRNVCGGGGGAGQQESVDAEEEDEAGEQKATFNALVRPDEFDARKARRVRWLSQVCEYWPLQRLCEVTDADIDALFSEYISSGDVDAAPLPPSDAPSATPTSASAFTGELEHDLQRSRRGRITLVGAGPGDPSLLTTAALNAIASADLILADKLVPEPVLALAPRRASVFIARKFPGNADAAQTELLEKGLAGVRAGMHVVRLKQGDPYVYGRGAEEVAFFENALLPAPSVKGASTTASTTAAAAAAANHAPVVRVIPGITSALCAPLFAKIPATHRAVADRILICTGTGRKGVAPDPPEYHAAQTTVFLMACHRLPALVAELQGKGWPAELPCAIVERASCADQRVVRSTLASVCAAVEEVGSRPPGLFVAGWACGVLRTVEGAWVVEEGL